MAHSPTFCSNSHQRIMPDILVTFEATFNLANKVIGWIPKVSGSLIFSQLSDRRTVDRMVMLWQIGAENRQDQSLVCPTPTHLNKFMSGFETERSKSLHFANSFQKNKPSGNGKLCNPDPIFGNTQTA